MTERTHETEKRPRILLVDPDEPTPGTTKEVRA
jgi:hypothetical protein